MPVVGGLDFLNVPRVGSTDMSAVDPLLERLQKLRRNAGLTPEDLERDLILGPGWIDALESGRVVPTLDVVLIILQRLGLSLQDLIRAIQPAVSLAPPISCEG